jgi:hypothetical protein
MAASRRSSRARSPREWRPAAIRSSSASTLRGSRSNLVRVRDSFDRAFRSLREPDADEPPSELPFAPAEGTVGAVGLPTGGGSTWPGAGTGTGGVGRSGSSGGGGGGGTGTGNCADAPPASPSTATDATAKTPLAADPMHASFPLTSQRNLG